MIFNIIYWNFGFLRMGTTGMTAQAYGADDAKQQATILFQALIVGLILAISVILLSTPLMYGAEYLLQLDSAQTPIVREYFFIRIWDAPASMMLYSLMGWLFGMQNAKYPLFLTIWINLCNVLISYVLVVHYGWEIAGVAWGTVIAQYSGVLVALIMLMFKYRHLLRAISILQQFGDLKKFLTINADIFIRTICLTLAFGIFYSQSSSLGSGVLAANVVLLLFVNWMSYAIDGFAYAAESLVGKYKGQSNDDSTLMAIELIFRWTAGAAILISIIYFLYADVLTAIFTDQRDVITEVHKYHMWVILFPILAFVCYIWDGVFIGLTAVHAMRNSMILAFMLYLPTLIIGGHYFGNHGLWAGLLLFMIYRGGVQSYFFWKQKLTIH
jgi:MATE family multidrug resistance protein